MRHKIAARAWGKGWRGSVLGCLGSCLLLGQPRTARAQLPPPVNNKTVKDNPEAFAVQLQLNRTTVLPFEPVGAIATLRNVSNAPASLTDRWGSSCWIQRGENGYRGSYGGYPSNPVSIGEAWPSTKVFAPQEKLDNYEVLALINDYTGSRTELHPLRDPGNYYVSARYLSIYSPKTKLTVVQPTGDDLAAYNFLRTHTSNGTSSDSQFPNLQQALDRYFTSDVLLFDIAIESEIEEWDAYLKSTDGYKNYSEDMRLEREKTRKEHEVNILFWHEQLMTFVRLYPRSRYAQWGRLSLLFLESVPITFKVRQKRDRGNGDVPQSDLAKLRSAHAHATQLAPQLPDVLSGAAWYEAGMMSLALEQRDIAEKEFKNATFRDATIGKRIQDARRYLR